MCFTASTLRSAELNEALSEKLGPWMDRSAGSPWQQLAFCSNKIGMLRKTWHFTRGWLGCWVNSEKLWRGVVCYWRYIGDTRQRMESIWRLLEISPRECRVTQDWRLHGFEDIDNRLLVSESYWNKMNIVMVRELSVGVQRGNQRQ